MLIGQYTSKVSRKRRVAVPSKFRKELGETFILIRWYENCLALVSKKQWKELFDRLIGEAKGITQAVRDTDRFLLGQAYELVPDEQGRVIIPEALAVFAELEEEAVFIGLVDRVELWNKTKWEEREKYVEANAGELIDKLTGRDEKE